MMPTQRLRLALLVAVATAGLSACDSDDETPDTARDAGPTIDSGTTTPPPAPAPPDMPAVVDAGPIECDVPLEDSCDECLARHCCESLVTCKEHGHCGESYASYRACVGIEDDPSDCFADFIEAARSDAGPGLAEGEALLACILSRCIGCGAPGTL